MILIAEDNKDVQKAYARILQGHELRVCDDAADAIALIEGGLRPDLIISDLEMPLVLGTSFCHAVRQMGLKTPFLLSSGAHGLEQLAKQCGADGWAEKGTGVGMRKIMSFAMEYDKKKGSGDGG